MGGAPPHSEVGGGQAGIEWGVRLGLTRRKQG